MPPAVAVEPLESQNSPRTLLGREPILLFMRATTEANHWAGISALGYYLPPTERTVAEVVGDGQTVSDEARLTQLGFRSIRVAGTQSAGHLAIEAVRDLRARRDGAN